LAEQREEVEMYLNDPIIAKVIEIRKSGDKDILVNELINVLNNLKVAQN
jgi:hypothetical protein